MFFNHRSALTPLSNMHRDMADAIDQNLTLGDLMAVIKEFRVSNGELVHLSATIILFTILQGR